MSTALKVDVFGNCLCCGRHVTSTAGCDCIESAPPRDAELASLRAEVERLNECLRAANYGDVPKGWDDVIARAELAETRLAELTKAAEGAVKVLEVCHPRNGRRLAALTALRDAMKKSEI